MFPGVIGRGYCQSGTCQKEQLGEMHGDEIPGKRILSDLIRKGKKWKIVQEA